MGAIIAPNATNPLNIPDALSFKEWFSSVIPSFYITLSIISGKDAIKKNKHPILNKKYPTSNSPKFWGRSNRKEGPVRNNETLQIINAVRIETLLSYLTTTFETK